MDLEQRPARARKSERSGPRGGESLRGRAVSRSGSSAPRVVRSPETARHGDAPPSHHHPSAAGTAVLERPTPARTHSAPPAAPPAAPPPVARSSRRGLTLGLLLLIAAESLARNKTRTFLAMLGVIIGVGSVITMLALAQGTRRAVEAEIARRGTNTLSIQPKEQRRGGVGLGADSGQRLTLEDAAAILQHCPAVTRVSPRTNGSMQVKFGNRNTRAGVMGVTSDFFPIRALEIERGRAFRAAEIDGRARVCLLGSEVVRILFGNRDPLGRRVLLRGQHFEVIGVLREKGGNEAFWDDRVWIPVTTMTHRLLAIPYVHRIEVQARDQESLIEAQDQIETLLRQRHRLRAGKPDDFEVRNQAEMIETANETSGALTNLLAGIAAISLLVGGIGIMNILLVTVAERTREIGIRRAVGAYRRDILAQFLIEALLMCGIGAGIGIGAGLLASWSGAHFASWPIEVTAASLLLSSGCAVTVGLVFGIYPALRAAGLTPLQALRHER
jgi:putative ABC transport system permease protein